MTGISYLKSYEAAQVSEAVEKMWGSPGYEGLYWDEVVDRSLDRIKLKVWPVEEGKITELDTPAELDVFERSLST